MQSDGENVVSVRGVVVSNPLEEAGEACIAPTGAVIELLRRAAKGNSRGGVARDRSGMHHEIYLHIVWTTRDRASMIDAPRAAWLHKQLPAPAASPPR